MSGQLFRIDRILGLPRNSNVPLRRAKIDRTKGFANWVESPEKKKLKIVLKIIALRPFIRFSQTWFVHITKIRILQISKRFCGQMIPKIMWKAKANHKLNFFYIKVFKNLVLILTVLKTHRKPNINFKVPVHQLFPDVQMQNRNFLWKWIWRNLECNWRQHPFPA